MLNNGSPKFAYFAGEPLGVPVLNELMAAGLTPALVVCNPDRPAGRGQSLTPPPVRVAAKAAGIPVWQPRDLTDETAMREQLTSFDLFVVVAYNRILPQWLINLPKHQTLNLHPSLLPLRRGPNPIRSAIMENDPESVGVSVMLLDAKMDHGPLLAQEAFDTSELGWPPTGPELDAALATAGGKLLAATIPAWVAGAITPREQVHENATYTSKLNKSDGALDIDPYNLPRGEAARQMYCKIQGLAGWPGTFFMHDGQRIKVNEAQLIDDQLCLITITPEGKRPLPFAQWLPSISRK